ncbi:EKA-like protein [Blumeria hordei DH14]|uniref:EKA-like protein n=1 Tax=Blumeria graminis f. sp. hordei (strain DH14) TaxID=546991 RepID=N1JA37_BLUG1|nr:EKA-like protein [Blumeria hordei DH14]
MPPVRKKYRNVLLDNTRVRPRALAQAPDLVQSPNCVEMSKVSTKGKEEALPAVAEPDTDMIGSVGIVEKISQRASIPHGIGESSKPPPTTSKLSVEAAPNAFSTKESQPQAATKVDCPLELQPIIEAEQRRAAISGVEATLLPLTDRPPRPANPLPRAPDARSQTMPAVPVLPVKSTWATMAKDGLRQKAVPTVKAAPRPTAKAQLKEVPKVKFDKRLFLRLGSNRQWRKLSPLGAKAAIKRLICDGDHIDSVQRVKSGYSFLPDSELN